MVGRLIPDPPGDAVPTLLSDINMLIIRKATTCNSPAGAASMTL